MARKRLADLLREEVNKPADETEAPEKKTAGKGMASNQKAATGKSTTGRSRQSASVQQPAMKASSAEAKADEHGVAENGNTDAALVSQLHHDLDQARRREASLTEQLEQLQTELDAQSSLISSLKEDLRQQESLAGELKDAKATALQLAEANSKLTQELDQLRQAAQPKAESAQPALSRDRQSLAVKPPLPERQYPPDVRRRQEESLAHPMFPAGPMPGQLSNQDLGWVD